MYSLNLRFFKHYPAGFKTLFWTQALFNFGFYGLKAIFVLYTISQFHLKEQEAFNLFATFMALSYGTSIIGGRIADKTLGVRKTIIIGGLFVIAGIFCLICASFLSSFQNLFFLALALMSLGGGFFKPNLPSAVSQLFQDLQDPQKDSAFSILYMAMNLGSLLAPLVCGLVASRYGWFSSFILIGGIFLVGTYLFYKKTSLIIFKTTDKIVSSSNSFLLGVFLIGTLFCLSLLFKYQDYFHGLMGIVALASMIYFGKIFFQCDPQEKQNMFKIIFYIALFTLFCSLFEQAGSSLMVFFEHAVDRQVMNFLLPSSVFLSLSPLFVLILNPIVLFLWRNDSKTFSPLQGFFKLGIGFFLVGLSFWILGLSTLQDQTLAPLSWVVGAILVQTMGELWIIPVGFSNISKLSPPRFLSLMMSFWTMAIAYGHYFAGFIASFSIAETVQTSERNFAHYQTFFFNLGIFPVAIALIILLIYPSIKKLKMTRA